MPCCLRLGQGSITRDHVWPANGSTPPVLSHTSPKCPTRSPLVRVHSWVVVCLAALHRVSIATGALTWFRHASGRGCYTLPHLFCCRPGNTGSMKVEALQVSDPRTLASCRHTSTRLLSIPSCSPFRASPSTSPSIHVWTSCHA